MMWPSDDPLPFPVAEPWFGLARQGAGLHWFDEVEPNTWSTERLSTWCGWLAGRRWATLARFLDAGWSPPAGARLFADGRAADAAVRAALNGPASEARHVLVQPPHPAALLAVAPAEYVVTHPLRRAIHQKWADLVMALFQAGADPSLSCKGLPGNVLNHASGIGWTQGVRLTVEAGADPNGRDGTGRTPLQVAAELGLCASLRELVACGANPQALGARGAPLLHEITRRRGGAFTRGDPLKVTVETLLELGAPLALPEGRQATRLQARWARRSELSTLALRGAAVLLERALPVAEERQRSGRL